MKKGVILLAGLLLLTGCGEKEEKTVTCSLTSNENGIESMNISAKLDNDNISSIYTSIVFTDENIASTSCSIYKLMVNNSTDKEGINITCEGKTITIDGYEKFAGEEDIKELSGKTSAEFIETFEKEGYTCK